MSLLEVRERIHFVIFLKKIILLFISVITGIKPRALCMLGRSSSTAPHTQPSVYFFLRFFFLHLLSGLPPLSIRTHVIKLHTS